MRTGRRFFSVAGSAVFLGALAVTGITAFACSPNATLSLSSGATVGGTVTGTGANFVPGQSPVHLYLNGFSGTLLTSAPVLANGTISFQFVVPNVSTQYNFVGATETDSAGNSLTMNKVRGTLTLNTPPAPVQQPVQSNPPVVTQPGQQAPAQPPANANPAPVKKPAPASKPVTAGGTQAQAPVAAQPAPAVAAPQAPAAQPAAVAPAPADANVAPAPAPVQPQIQPAAGSPSTAHSSSHPAAVLAMALVLGVLVLAVAVAAFVAAGRRGAGAEAKARR